MVNIAPKLDIPILDVTLLHRCKHVVWPMGSRAIEISEILQVGPIPCKALFVIAGSKEIDAAPMRQKVGLIGDTLADVRIICQNLCDNHFIDPLGEHSRGIAVAGLACSNSDLELPPQNFTTIEPTGRPGHDRRVDSSHLLHEFFQNIVQDGSLEWRAENLRSAQLAAILHRLTQISARSGQEQISADVKQARPKTGRPSRSLCLRERPPCSQLGAGPL